MSKLGANTPFKVDVKFHLYGNGGTYKHYDITKGKVVYFPVVKFGGKGKAEAAAKKSAKKLEKWLSNNKLDTLMMLSNQKIGLPSRFTLYVDFKYYEPPNKNCICRLMHLGYIVAPFSGASKKFKILPFGNTYAFSEACKFYSAEAKLKKSDASRLANSIVDGDYIYKKILSTAKSNEFILTPNEKKEFKKACML